MTLRRATRRAAAAAAGTAGAVSYRPAHGSFSKTVVVDHEPSQPPAVALAADGTGIVAWSHSRRVYAVSIARGEVGKVKSVAASNGIDSLVVAAGPGGEASVAWIARRASNRRYEIRAARRFAGHAFGPARVVSSTRASVSELALAADETGRTTAAWPEDDFGRSAGHNGITTAVRTATALPGHVFGQPRVVTASGGRYRHSLSLVAVKGRVALPWGYKTDSRHVGVQATVGPAGVLGAPQTVVAATLVGDVLTANPGARITLAPSGAATVLATIPTEPAPKQITTRLVAIDGR